VVARDWLEHNIAGGWASCPITQNGCIRILSQPAYPGAESPAAVASRLAEAAATPWHDFWPDDLSLLDQENLDWRSVLGSRQLTDAYLLALAVRRDGRFVTFDQSIPLDVVPGAEPRHLVYL
jgi:toxin-antitoxin system PIN domain toxin